MKGKLNITIIAATVVLLIGALSYVYTAPYPGMAISTVMLHTGSMA